MVRSCRPPARLMQRVPLCPIGRQFRFIVKGPHSNGMDTMGCFAGQEYWCILQRKSFQVWSAHLLVIQGTVSLAFGLIHPFLVSTLAQRSQVLSYTQWEYSSDALVNICWPGYHADHQVFRTPNQLWTYRSPICRILGIILSTLLEGFVASLNFEDWTCSMQYFLWYFKLSSFIRFGSALGRPHALSDGILPY